MSTQKMFVWVDPYSVSYGSSLLIVVAESEEAARLEAAKGTMCSFGTPDNFQEPKDWSKLVEPLGAPDRVMDIPCAEWHEWSE